MNFTNWIVSPPPNSYVESLTLKRPECDILMGDLVVKTLLSQAETAGLILGQGLKISHAAGCGQKLKINK